MKQLFYRLRPINLLIVAATQLAIYYLVLKPIHQANSWLNITEHADLHYYIIVILTCIICAGGYIINDVFDQHIDKINKPHKAIGNIRKWVLVYKSLFIIGLLLTVYLGYICQAFYFVPIYILSWLSLYAYSMRLKCTPLWGNVLVAVFSASVILALLGPGLLTYVSVDFSIIQQDFSSFILYGIVAFLATMIREIVKDIEDVKGDMDMNCNTLPVTVGVEKSKIFAAFFHILLFVVLASFMVFYYQAAKFVWVVGLAVIFVWSIFLLSTLMKAKVIAVFHAIQYQWKLLMILGLILLLINK